MNKTMTYKESLQGAALFFCLEPFCGIGLRNEGSFLFCVSGRRPKEEKAWRMRMMKWKD